MLPRVVAALGCALLALVAAAVVGASGSSRVYADPKGDVTGGPGPDVTAIVVSHDAQRITFTIRFAGSPPLRASERGGWVDVLLVGIDTPPFRARQTPTGWRGVDYAAGLHGGQSVAVVVKLGNRSPPAARVPAAVGDRWIRFSVPRTAIGDPHAIGFLVAAGRETATEGGGGSDAAPRTGAFRYVLEP